MAWVRLDAAMWSWREFTSLTAMGSKRTLHRTRGKGSADKRFRHCVYVDLLATHHEDRC